MSNTKMTLVIYSVGFFVLGAIIALASDRLLFKHVDPRDSMQTTRAFQDWRLTCSARTDKNGGCVLQGAILDKASNTPLVQLTIGRKDANDTLAVVTPLGVLIPPGMRISVGTAKPKVLAFKTCLQGGCVATLPLDSSLTTAMTQNAGGQIVVVNGAGKTVGLNYSLQGFKDALAARAVDLAARVGH
jgi:invasion protein IalB